MDLASLRALLGEDAALLDAPLPPGLAPLARASLAGPDYTDRVWGAASTTGAWRRNLQALLDAGRNAGTGWLVFLAAEGPPDDLGALAQEGGCSGLVAEEIVLLALARRYAHRLPLVARVRRTAPWYLREHGIVGLSGARVDATPGDDFVGFSEGTTGGALSWDPTACDDAPSALPALRARVAANPHATLVSAPLNDRRAALRASVLGKRAGALGIVITGALSTDVARDVATLHAVQDVWDCGAITVV